MTQARRITRRAFLRGIAVGAGGMAIAGCVGPSATAPPTPASTPTPAPTTTVLPLRQRIARLLVVGFRGLSIGADDPVARAIGDGLGGVILFDLDEVTGVRNIESPEQVGRLVAELRALAPGRELIVAIDQEGGRVLRLAPKYGFPAAESQASIGAAAPAAVRAWAEGIAATLADVGINLNLAPVVDLDINPTNPAVGALDRAFSADPAIVARDAGIEVEAHRERGVRTALKHFPGLGSASTNTDFDVADVTGTWRDVELDPYRDLFDRGLVDSVMAAHVVNGQIDASAPASLSRATVTDLLRDELGWDGVVVTDDLGAAAITEAFGFEDAIALALDAGNDLLLLANQHDYDPELAARGIAVIEGLVRDGRVAEARIDASIARLDQLFNGAG